MARKLGRFLVNTGRGVITPIAGRKAPVRREKTQFFADASVTYNKTGSSDGIVRGSYRVSGADLWIDRPSLFAHRRGWKLTVHEIYNRRTYIDFETGSLFRPISTTAFGSSVSEEQPGGKKIFDRTRHFLLHHISIISIR